ncbi:endospore germination permease [Sutcliffiella horikoshii]|uniref:endospore germination permease n=1 Tax=Sutcliffiella horikoshii TaxID=79883 RepID=UPI001CBAFC76|nr:endospore germination permease [Sutcliffiella horikoshii]UAL47622.1 endospore germination permease [Sutcliffiella horikoshii]
MTFSRLQLSFVIILFIGISNHVLMLPHLLFVAKRDAWVCVLVGYGILLIWGMILFFIMSRNKQKMKLATWIAKRAGRVVSASIMFIYFFHISIIALISFYDFITSIKIYFLPLTPQWIVVLPFLLLCVWGASSNLKTIVYSATFLLPIVWILGYFVAFSTISNKDYSYMFPILVNGSSPIISGITVVLGGSVDILLILLLQQYVSKPFKLWQLLLLITILLGLILGPLLGSIASFGPNVAAVLRFPAFEQWRLVELGEHVSHLDFFAVFQFISGAVIRVSLCLYFLKDIGFTSNKVKSIVFWSASTSLFFIGILPISDLWVQTAIGTYFYPGLLLIGIILTLSLFVISFLPQKVKGTEAV